MPNDPNLVLTGFMGTGKSAVGRVLAGRMGRELLDMDAEIECREGCRVSELFARRGEAAFRRCEQALAQELARPSALVVATGGGVVLDPRNVECLQRGGVLVCLLASLPTLLARLADEDSRPLLAGSDRGGRLQRLWQQRRPLYEALPLKVHTDDCTPAEVAERVLALYRRHA
mgnify:CR=1 FL=1